MSTEIEKLFEVLEEGRELRQKIRKLQEIEAWAIESLPFKDGDEVVLNETIDLGRENGWYPYREILVKGCTGTVHTPYLSNSHWCVYFEPEVEWSVSEFHGRSVYRSKTPHHFMMRLTPGRFRKREETDLPLIVPDGAKDGH